MTSEERAAELVERFEAEPSVFEASADVLAFDDELLAKDPGAGVVLGGARVTPTSWSVTPERSNRALFLDLVGSVSEEMLDDIVALAREHELVLYDPQGPDAPPSRRAGRARPPWWAGCCRCRSSTKR